MAVNDANKNQNAAKNNEQQEEVVKTIPNVDTIASLFSTEGLTELSAMMFIIDSKDAQTRVKELLAMFNQNEKAVEQATEVYADIVVDISEIKKGNAKASEKAQREAYEASFSTPAMGVIGMIGQMVFLIDNDYIPERFDKATIKEIVRGLRLKVTRAKLEQKEAEGGEKLVEVPAFGAVFANFTDRAQPPKDQNVWLSDIIHFFPRVMTDMTRSLPSLPNMKFNPF